MTRTIAGAVIALALAIPAAHAQGTTSCEKQLNEMKPLFSSVTDTKLKQGLTDRWGRAEAAMKSKDEKACMEHALFIQKALKEGKM
jgi:hypothetical protein